MAASDSALVSDFDPDHEHYDPAAAVLDDAPPTHEPTGFSSVSTQPTAPHQEHDPENPEQLAFATGKMMVEEDLPSKPHKGMFTPFRGIRKDLKRRLPLYLSDWKEGFGIGLLRPATYVFVASIVPALAFGERFSDNSDGQLGGAQVILSTAMCGFIQSFFGGQPLLITGVAGPIVIVYQFMYEIADDNDIPFLPWASCTLFWAAGFIFLLAIFNACSYIHSFTRFSGELFGLLISVLFIQQGIQGLIDEYDVGDSSNARNFSGTWALFLALAQVITSFKLRGARSWKSLNGTIRGMIADYSTILMLILWTGISYAPQNTPAGIPRRLLISDALEDEQAQSTWYVVRDRMGELESSHIWAAMIPGFVITVLFFFDHNISGQLSQVRAFNLKKPHAYHWDFFLLGIMTTMCGLTGVPPANGAIPQGPMHTFNCGQLVKDPKNPDAKPVFVVKEQRWSNLMQSSLIAVCIFIASVLQSIPRSIVWGYFIYMGLEALGDSQFVDRVTLFWVDRSQLSELFKTPRYSYLRNVELSTIYKFTLLQMFLWGICYGLTWAGTVGISFPIPIMLIVPVRKNLFVKLFSAKDLRALDPMVHEHDLDDDFDDDEDTSDDKAKVIHTLI